MCEGDVGLMVKSHLACNCELPKTLCASRKLRMRERKAPCDAGWFLPECINVL